MRKKGNKKRSPRKKSPKEIKGVTKMVRKERTNRKEMENKKSRTDQLLKT